MRNVSLVPSALIDAAELARMLSVSKPTIWRLSDAGKLPPAIALTSPYVRWKRDSVLAWLESLDTVNEQRSAAANGEASKDGCPPLAGEVAR